MFLRGTFFLHWYKKKSSLVKVFFFSGFVKSIRKLLLIFFLAVRHKKIFFRILWRRTTTIAMKYQETAAEIEKEIQVFNEAKRIHRVVILCRYYHVNPCRKNNCNNYKVIMEYRNLFCLIIIRKLQKKWCLILCSVVDKITMIFILCLYFYNLLQ